MGITIEGRKFSIEDINSGKIIELCEQLPHLQKEIQDLNTFLIQWFNDEEFVDIKTSGSTNSPKTILAPKKSLIKSAEKTCEFFNLTTNSTLLLCMNLKYVGAKMMVIRCIVCKGNLLLSEVKENPLHNDNHKDIDFAAMVPLQVYSCIKNNEHIEKIKCLIIGGQEINKELEDILVKLNINIYSTYGMSETYSHIALRKIGEQNYVCLSGIKVDTNRDNCLIIKAKDLLDEDLQTRDIAQLKSDTEFIIKGRIDNVINSGGIKILAEDLEQKIKDKIKKDLCITSIKDDKYGNKLVLLCKGEEIKDLDFNYIERYHRPKLVFFIDDIPHTENYKIDRIKCREIAKSLYDNELKSNISAKDHN